MSLPVCKKHAVHRIVFILAMNDAENIYWSENMAVVWVFFNYIPPPSFEDTDGWVTGVGH